MQNYAFWSEKEWRHPHTVLAVVTFSLSWTILICSKKKYGNLAHAFSVYVCMYIFRAETVPAGIVPKRDLPRFHSSPCAESIAEENDLCFSQPCWNNPHFIHFQHVESFWIEQSVRWNVINFAKIMFFINTWTDLKRYNVRDKGTRTVEWWKGDINGDK